MAYRLISTEKFEKSSAKTAKWLKKNWSEKSAKSFQEKLSATIVKIIKTPTAGKLSAKRRDVRSVLVTKYNKLYYRLSEDTITLLELFETKQDPAKNKYE